VLKLFGWFAAAGVPIALGAAWGWTEPLPPSRLTFLAVGQGDCVVLQHAGCTVLVDAAPATDRFDAGRRLAAPALHALGVETLDLVLLTHPDAAHVGGLPALAAAFPIGRVVASASFQGHPGLRAVLSRARIGADRVVWIEDEARVAFAGLAARIVAPHARSDAEDNQGSLFVHLTNGRATATLSGDAGVETEASVLERGGRWRAVVAMAGHHGSATSSGARWIDAVAPRFAVVSCGRDNRYGHPHPSVLARYEAIGAHVLRTDRDGALRFTFGADGVRLEAPKAGAPR